MSYSVKMDLSNTERLLKEIARVENLKAEVGVNAGAVESNGVPTSEVALYLEYGWTQSVTPAQQGWFWSQGFHVQNTLVLPPRPTFRFTAEKYHDKWEKLGAKVLTSPAFGTAPLETAYKALQLACMEAQADLQNTIRTNGEGTFPERSTLTMAMYSNQMEGHRRTGRNVSDVNTSETSKALMRHGDFLQSIIYNIEGA